MFFKQKVILQFSSTKNYERSGMEVKMRQIPRIGEKISFNVVDRGEVVDIKWRSDVNSNIYPIIFVERVTG